jgi:hypothetical protein
VSGFLLRGQGVNPGAGAPSRVPIGAQPGLVPPHGGPNATYLQKLINQGTGQPATSVFDQTRFGRLTTVSFTLANAAVDLLALNAPSQLRVFLSVFNSVGSAGVINVGFDQQALGAGGAFTLPAGGFFFLDEFVPQNEIHISCNTATSFVAITYCDAPYPP